MNVLFRALQDGTRRSILEMVHERDLTAGEIADAFPMSKASISCHLDLLKQASLVSAEKEGAFIRYSLETTVLDESLGWILNLMKKGKRDAKTKPDHKDAPGTRDPIRAAALRRRALG